MGHISWKLFSIQRVSFLVSILCSKMKLCNADWTMFLFSVTCHCICASSWSHKDVKGDAILVQSKLFSKHHLHFLCLCIETLLASKSKSEIRQRWHHLLRPSWCNLNFWHHLHFFVRIEQSSPASEVGDKDKDGKGESSLASQSSFWAWTGNSQLAFSTSSDLESVECNLNMIKKIKSMFRYIHNTSRE